MSNNKRTKEETQALRESLVDSILKMDQSVSKAKLMKKSIATLQASVEFLVSQQEAKSAATNLTMTQEQLDAIVDRAISAATAPLLTRIEQLESAPAEQPASAPATPAEDKVVEVPVQSDDAKKELGIELCNKLIALRTEYTQKYVAAMKQRNIVEAKKWDDLYLKNEQDIKDLKKEYGNDIDRTCPTEYNAVGRFLITAADGTRKHGNAVIDAITKALLGTNKAIHNAAYIALKFSHDTSNGAIKIMDKGGHLLVNTSASGIEGLADLIGKTGVQKVKQELAL